MKDNIGRNWVQADSQTIYAMIKAPYNERKSSRCTTNVSDLCVEYDYSTGNYLMFAAKLSCTVSSEVTQNSTLVKNNQGNYEHISRTLISIGCAEISDRLCLCDADEKHCIEDIVVLTINKNSENQLALPLSFFDKQCEEVKSILAGKGVFFQKDGFKLFCEYTVAKALQCKVRKEFYSFYYQDGQWKHKKFSEMAQNAADTLDISRRLGLETLLNQDFNLSLSGIIFQNLTLFLYETAASLFSVLRYYDIAGMVKLALVSSDYRASISEFQKMFKPDHGQIIFLSKGLEAKLSSVIDLPTALFLSDCSKYMKERILSRVAYYGEEGRDGEVMLTLPLLICDINDRPDEKDFLVLPYDPVDIGCITDILMWAQVQFLKDTNMATQLGKIVKQYEASLDDEVDTKGMKQLVSVLLALADLYLPKMGVSSHNLGAILTEYRNYLLNSSGYSGELVIERIKTYLIYYLSDER